MIHLNEAHRNSTRQRLLETVVHLLDAQPRDSITTGLVLQLSGASTSSLYHYYGNFSSLLIEAEIVRFQNETGVAKTRIHTLLTRAKTRKQFLQSLSVLIAGDSRHSRDQLPAAPLVPRDVTLTDKAKTAMRDALQCLIHAIGNELERAQGQGWLSKDLDKTATASIVLSYLAGRDLNGALWSEEERSRWRSRIRAHISLLFA